MEFVALIVLFAIALAIRAGLREKDGTFLCLTTPWATVLRRFQRARPTTMSIPIQRSHMPPGNIYYQALITPMKTMFDDDLCTNHVYSFLACNIYHREHDWYSRFDSSLSSGSDN